MRFIRFIGRGLATIAGLGLLSACLYLLLRGQPATSAWPAIAAGILGYFLFKPGKRSARVEVGGVVVSVVSDDTGLIRTGINAAVSSISHQQISEADIKAAMEASKSGTPPLPPISIKTGQLSSETLRKMDKL